MMVCILHMGDPGTLSANLGSRLLASTAKASSSLVFVCAGHGPRARDRHTAVVQSMLVQVRRGSLAMHTATGTLFLYNPLQ